MQESHAGTDREMGGATGASVNDSAKSLGRAAVNQARSVAETGKTKLVEGAEGVASALRHASEGLRSDEQDELARYTRNVANKLELAASTLKNRDLPSFVGDVTRFAQRQPALFLGGAFTAGLVLARFLKSTAGTSGQAREPVPSGVDDESGTGPGASDVPTRMGETRDDQSLLEQVTAPSGFGPAPGGYGPASAPAGAHGGSGTFGAEGAGGGPGNLNGPGDSDPRAGE